MRANSLLARSRRHAIFLSFVYIKKKSDKKKTSKNLKWKLNDLILKDISILMHRSDLDGSILLAKNRTDHPGPS